MSVDTAPLMSDPDSSDAHLSTSKGQKREKHGKLVERRAVWRRGNGLGIGSHDASFL
jgi:hypothetical protein